jgi:hypothetical protein
MNPLPDFKITLPVLIIIVLSVLPRAQAVNPAPDGCYPNFTTAEGCAALNLLTTGAGNTALGWRSLFSTSGGSFNTGVGAGALVLNNGDSNTAVGAAALLVNTTGSENTAVGTAALLNNTVDGNTAVGFSALTSNTTGGDNTAEGTFALVENATGADNTSNGFAALSSNIAGNSNTAFGSRALIFNIGDENTAVGFNALQINTTGAGNTAIGVLALINNNGGGNVGVGANAGFAATTGNGNVYIGADVDGVAGESAHTYIRNINTTSVSGGGTDSVTVDLTSGLLGHLSSSRRFKEDIQPMNNASETLYRLQPVTYRYKKEIDHTQSPAFGLIAEDVAEVNPALVAHDAKGQPESVHYEMVNAMLLNEFLKEHHQVQDLKVIVTRQQKQIESLTAGLQKVSAQLEMSKAAPQAVLNDQ